MHFWVMVNQWDKMFPNKLWKKLSLWFVEFGCTKVGDQTDFIKTALTCILDTPRYVPVDMRFDMLVLVSIGISWVLVRFSFHEEDFLMRLIFWYFCLQSLGLLINMVEHCGVNKRKLVEAETCRSYEVIADNATTRVPATKALCEVWPVLCILYKMM